MALIIRQAKADDIHAIMAVVRETVEEMQTYGNDQWDATYPDDTRFLRDIADGTLYLAEESGQMLGFVSVDQIEPPGYAGLPWSGSGDALVIHRFAVAANSRGQGVATLLEAFACRLATENGIRHIKVDTHSSNTGMQTFLARRGYRKVGEMEFLGKDRPFFCYEKLLTEKEPAL